MILLIDNYDSFSFNLYQAIGSINPNIKVIRNDELTVGEIEKLNASHIVLSPGPGRPSGAGVCKDVVKKLGGYTAILGVCLGHQAIFESYGGVVDYAKDIQHGKASEIALDTTSPLFRGLSKQITVGRYHSLIGISDTLPSELNEIAKTASNEIMAVAHKKHRVFGVQFHPESILTPQGEQIIKNFLIL